MTSFKRSFLLFLTFSLIGCTLPSPTLTVRFETQSSLSIPSQTLTSGELLEEPADPIKEGYFFLHWYKDQPLLPWDFNEPVTQSMTLTAYYETEVTTPAVLRLNLDIPLEYVTRETYEIATMEVENTQTPWTLNTTGLTLRGRGNGSSWGYEQKGYRLKFDQKVSLFGEVASRHWVLTPGGHDFGLIRNHAAFTIGKNVMTNIPYTSSSRYVEVYVNDFYYGLYNLFEHTRVDEGRVDIESEYGVLDTGYLVELDAYAYGNEGIDYFYVQGIRYPFSVKSPEPDEWIGIITEEAYRQQITFIQQELQNLVNAIYVGDESTIRSFMHVDSFIDMYLLHELFKNTDSGWSSFYVYRPTGGGWIFGPPWDFDLTAGISRGDMTTENLYVAETIMSYSDYTSNEMMMTMMRYPWFIEDVKTRYRDIASSLSLTITSLSSIQVRYEDAFNRHGERWYWFSLWQKEHDFVLSWLMERHLWLLNWASE